MLFAEGVDKGTRRVKVGENVNLAGFALANVPIESYKLEFQNDKQTTITLNGNTAVQIKGDKAGECAINGVQLISALLQLAQGIDAKVPQTAGQEVSYVNAVKEGLLNQSIQYI